MKDFLLGLLAIITVVAVTLIAYLAYGFISYLGLPALGIDLTFGQGVILAVLISTAGTLFVGGRGRKQAKGDE